MTGGFIFLISPAQSQNKEFYDTVESCPSTIQKKSNRKQTNFDGRKNVVQSNNCETEWV